MSDTDLLTEQERELVKRTRWIWRIWIGVFLLLGAVFVYFGMQAYTDVRIKDWLSVLGEILLGASLTAILFSSMNEIQMLTFVRAAVDPALRKILKPIAADMELRAIRDYRWDCYVEPAAAKFGPTFVLQTIRLTYRLNNLPREIRCVSGHSKADFAFQQFYNDRRYFFRWNLDAGERILDAADDDVFCVKCISVDGDNLEIPAKRKREIPGGSAYEYSAKVPSNRVGKTATIAITFHVVKWVGTDKRIDFNSRFFSPCMDSEFRIHVSPHLRASRIECSPNVTSLDPAAEPVVGELFSPAASCKGAFVFLRFPVQTGTAVHFIVTREANASSVREESGS